MTLTWHWQHWHDTDMTLSWHWQHWHDIDMTLSWHWHDIDIDMTAVSKLKIRPTRIKHCEMLTGRHCLRLSERDLTRHVDVKQMNLTEHNQPSVTPASWLTPSTQYHHQTGLLQLHSDNENVVTLLMMLAKYVMYCTWQQQQHLESIGYSTLPSPPRLMRRTHTQRDSVTPNVAITSLAKRWRR